MANSHSQLLQHISQGLDIIGDRWSLLILREAFYGRNRFEQFRKHTGISRATLTRRLNTLVEHDVFYKRPISTAKCFEYNFTERGLGLLGASLLAQQLENKWKEDEGLPEVKLFHKVCKHELEPRAVCRHCQETLKPEDIEWRSLEAGVDELSKLSFASAPRKTREKQPLDNARVGDLIGNRWSLLILIAGFLGTTRFDDFTQRLGIAPGILTERLKAMIENQLLQRHQYSSSPERFEYLLTPKGRATYNFVLALRQWILEGVSEILPPSNMIHTTCGNPLVQEVVCDHCNQKPWPKDVTFADHGQQP